jgi:hypothetical protein
VQILFNNGIGQFPTGTAPSIGTACRNFDNFGFHEIECQGMPPLINNSFGKTPGPVILGFLNPLDFGPSFTNDPRLQNVYGIVKDPSSQQLIVQQCVSGACQDSDLPELPACGMKKGGWLISKKPIVIDPGDGRPRLVLATQRQPECSNVSIVVAKLSTTPGIVCGGADCVISIPFDLHPVEDIIAGKFSRHTGVSGPDIALSGAGSISVMVNTCKN